MRYNNGIPIYAKRKISTYGIDANLKSYMLVYISNTIISQNQK